MSVKGNQEVLPPSNESVSQVLRKESLMKNVSLLHIFNDLNGRIIYRPYDQFEEKNNNVDDFKKFKL
jgi:hypothetical protein